MRDFRELKVWEKAHSLTLACYQTTKALPRYEVFGLASQIQRCSASIPANIAEGCGRRGNAELHRYLQIACGSVSELEYHVLLAKDLGYISSDMYDSMQKQIIDLRRMLAALTRKVGDAR